ncbi:MAG TPA: hypothetical protein DEO85_05290 [Maritimibacter sp.]|nr:hypothetical protein [Maritimibacter sp.]
MSTEQANFDEKKATIWFFAIALLVVVALVVGFLTLGLAGVALVMVAATPVIYIVLIMISVGA